MDIEPVNLHGTTDASVWAKEFCRIAKTLGHDLDEGWMISWFANAIMTGYDKAPKNIWEGLDVDKGMEQTSV